MENKTLKNERYHILDTLRSFAVVNMTAYHFIWDLVFIFGVNIAAFHGLAAYVWQQFICQTFILISGFCIPFGHKKLQRAATVSLLGILISVVTYLVIPEDAILFGILTLIGACMFIAIPLDKISKRLNFPVCFFVCIALFIITKSINSGYLGFGNIKICRMPEFLYANYLTAALGFPPKNFCSSDYFPLFPWIFLFFSGYFLNRILSEKNMLGFLKPSICPPLEFIGRHALVIYILHQPIIFLILKLIL